MEIKSLTGLRGVAALIVLWFHAKAALVARGLDLHFPRVIERIFFSGGLSVDIFFVLSGFILALTYRGWFDEKIEAATYIKYFRRRFARIYPLHFVLLVVTIGAVLATQALQIKTYLGLDRFDFSTLPEHFLLVHAWGVFFSNSGTWNPPTWSISIELLAYMLMPIVLFCLVKVKHEHSHWLLAGAILLGFSLNYLTAWGDYGFAGISRGLCEFLLGCITARYAKGAAATWLHTETGSWLTMLALLIAIVAINDTGFIIGLCTAPLIIALCGNNSLSRFFSLKPIYFLGEISYSVYIGHFLYTMVIWRLIRPEWMAANTLNLIIGAIAINAIVIALSTLTYYLIEQPGRNLLSDKKR